jgi:sulfite reductase alpha subunit-like flavoprotein
MPLTVPDNAPFTGPQRMWLKGFLDGINTSLLPAAPGTEASAALQSGVPVTIAWGSQTGNSESLGKKLAKALTAKGHRPSLRDMAEINPSELTGIENFVIITSTYGDGEPPDNAVAFYTALHYANAPLIPSTNYAVFALGDSNYSEFCKCGRDFDQRLASLGAKRLLPIVESDVDFDVPFTQWLAQFEQALKARI